MASNWIFMKAVEEGKRKHREQMRKEMKAKDPDWVDYPTHVLRENQKKAEEMRDKVLNSNHLTDDNS